MGSRAPERGSERGNRAQHNVEYEIGLVAPTRNELSLANSRKYSVQVLPPAGNLGTGPCQTLPIASNMKSRSWRLRGTGLSAQFAAHSVICGARNRCPEAARRGETVVGE